MFERGVENTLSGHKLCEPASKFLALLFLVSIRQLVSSLCPSISACRLSRDQGKIDEIFCIALSEAGPDSAFICRRLAKTPFAGWWLELAQMGRTKHCAHDVLHGCCLGFPSALFVLDCAQRARISCFRFLALVDCQRTACFLGGYAT